MRDGVPAEPALR